MLLHYRRTKLLNTTFQDEDNNDVFRTETTYCLGLPTTTRIFRVESVDMNNKSEKSSVEHRDNWASESVVATIDWTWPAANNSTVTFYGKTMPFKQVLEPGRGCTSNDGYFTMHGQLFVWKSNRFNPRLFNATTHEEVATYHRGKATTEPVSHLDSFIIISPTVSKYQDIRVLDTVFVTYFLYKCTRDFTWPFMVRWWIGIQHVDVSSMFWCSGRIELLPAKSWRDVEREPCEKEVPLIVC